MARPKKKAAVNTEEEEEEDEEDTRLRIPLHVAHLVEAEEFAGILREKGKGLGNTTSQWLRRSGRSTKGAQKHDEILDIRRRVMEGFDTESDDIFPNVPMFCDPEQPQWFALQVALPEPRQASKVVKMLQYGLDSQLPAVSLPDGKVIKREMEIWNPKKKVKAISLNTRRMSQRTVSYKDGSFVLFKAIMDRHLAAFLEPNFEDEGEYWSKRLRRMPRNLITNYVGGVFLEKEHVHVPRPCSEEFIAEVTEWEALKEEWVEEQVLKLEYGDNIPSDMLSPELANEAAMREFKDRLGQAQAFRSHGGNRGLPKAAAGVDPSRRESLALKGILNSTVRGMEDQLVENELRDLRKLDGGGWNVGTVSFKRSHRLSKRPGRPAIEEDGDEVPWNREAVGAFQEAIAPRGRRGRVAGDVKAPYRDHREGGERKRGEEEYAGGGRGAPSRIRLPGRSGRRETPGDSNGRSGGSRNDDSLPSQRDGGRNRAGWYSGGRGDDSAPRQGEGGGDRAGWFTGSGTDDSSLAGAASSGWYSGSSAAKPDAEDIAFEQWSEEWFGEVDDPASSADLARLGREGGSQPKPYSGWENDSFINPETQPKEQSRPNAIRFQKQSGAGRRQPGKSDSARSEGSRQPRRSEDDTKSSSGWYEGTSQVPDPATTTSSGWYDAAAAARDQYSRPQNDSSGGWYQGPAQADSAPRGQPQWSNPGWESKSSDRGPSKSTSRQGAGELPMWDSPIDPGLQQTARDASTPREWERLISDLAAESDSEESERRESAARDAQDGDAEFGANPSAYARGGQGDPGGSATRGGRGGRGDFSGRGRADEGFGSRSYGDRSSQEGARQRTGGWQTSSRQDSSEEDDLDWDDFVNIKPTSPSAAAAGFREGVGVSVTGGRYKGMGGEVLAVRGGVVRVALSGGEGDDGPAEVELPATQCSPKE